MLSLTPGSFNHRAHPSAASKESPQLRGPRRCGPAGRSPRVRSHHQVPVSRSSWVQLQCGWWSSESHLLLDCEGLGQPQPVNPGAPRVPTARPTGFHKPLDVDRAACVDKAGSLGALWSAGIAQSFLGWAPPAGPSLGPCASPVLRTSMALSGSQGQSLLNHGPLRGQEGPSFWGLSLGGALSFWGRPQGV